MSEGKSASGGRLVLRRWVAWLGCVVMVLVVGVGLGWAGAMVLTPPHDVLNSSTFTFVKVVNGEVGSSISLNTVAEWTPVPIGTNQAVGTVTTVTVTPGDEVKAGSVLYTVNLRPVVIGQGQVPSFHALAPGSAGADVAQLQGMLGALGFFHATPDGHFGSGTTVAVKAWQKSLGLTPDGVVQPGDLVFVPSLPTRVALDAEVIHRGRLVSGGEPVVKGLPAAPAFRVPVTDAQAAMIPIGTRVQITAENTEWEGLVTEQRTDSQNGTTIILAGKDGGSICGQDCGSIPVTGQTLLPSKIVTVESVSGLVVPSAALLSSADGTVSVTDRKGMSHEVTVTTSARGMSVIEGVPSGTRVRVPATAGK